MKRYRRLALLALIVLAAAILACNTDQQPTEVPVSESQVATAVAQTPEAVPTATAPRVADAPTDTPEPNPTDTPTLTPEPKPTDTPGPTNTPGASGCSDDSKFIADVNFPDNTPLTPGQTFTKIWRIQNNGSCTWTTDYRLVLISGERMGAPRRVRLSRDVPPGGSYEVSVTFTAPTEPGTYRSRWQLRTPDGALFGARPYVQILVPAPTDIPTPTDTPTPKPTDAPPGGPGGSAGLKEELFFSPPGGGGVSGCLACPAGGKPPEIVWFDLDCICLRGFPFNEKISVDLHAPNGDVYSAIFLVEVERAGTTLVRIHPPVLDKSLELGYVGQENGVNTIYIKLWGAVSLPTGKWYAAARSRSAYAEGQFRIKDTGWEVISVIPDTGANPFEGERGLAHSLDCCAPGYHNFYSAGERTEIVGIGFPPNRDLPLGIYYQGQPEASDPAILIRSKMVTTDSSGNVRTSYRIRSSDPSGCYRVIVVTDVDSEYDQESTFLGATGCFRIP
jgi:hypothetical protein